MNLDALRYSGILDNVADLAEHPNYTFIHGDICHPKTVQSILNDQRVNAVINCAAETHVERSLQDPYNFARTDVLGTAVLLEESRRAGVERFLHVSTDEVYGSLHSGMATEGAPLHPNNPYAASKAGGDHLALSYWASYQFPVMITRGCNTYGPSQYPEKLIPLLTTNALEDQPLPIYGDGRHRRDWLYVSDHCAAIELVLRKGRPGSVYNISGGEERTNIAVAEAILRHLGKSTSSIRLVQDRPGHDRRYAIDAGRVQALGWKADVSFERGLQKTVEWYRHHEPWWKRIRSGEFQAYYDRLYRKRLEEGRPYVSDE